MGHVEQSRPRRATTAVAVRAALCAVTALLCLQSTSSALISVDSTTSMTGSLHFSTPEADPRASSPTPIRVSFSNFWPHLRPEANFFLSMLRDYLRRAGSQHAVEVVPLEAGSDIHFFSVFSHEAPQLNRTRASMFFVAEPWVGFDADEAFFASISVVAGRQAIQDESRLVLLPLWVLSINWFNDDAWTFADPIPFPLDDAVLGAPRTLHIGRPMATSLDRYHERRRFAAYVVSNPENPIRNDVKSWLERYRPVSSAGKLHNTFGGFALAHGPREIGGEMAKVAFYRQHRFVVAFENNVLPGYVTEKLLHPKLAGAVPIYWGADDADEFFRAEGFLHVRKHIHTSDQLVDVVKAIDQDPKRWAAMADTPALKEDAPVILTERMDDICERLLRKAGLGHIRRPKRLDKDAVLKRARGQTV